MGKKRSFWSVLVFLITLLLSFQSIAFAEDTVDGEKHVFDEHYKIKKDKGFSLDEKIKIDEKDHHFGWSLGSLYVTGFTQKAEDGDGNPVFIKIAGDKVQLGFELKQKVDKLNGDKNLSIAKDKKGYDQYFEVAKTNFKHGTLIIRHTDYQGTKGDPIIYTDYLSAKAKVNANTLIDLKEEGDYEVALDYSVKYAPRKVFGKEIAPTTSDYTIRLFKFSIRNGNSMFFPFDLATGNEMTNKSFTEKGFSINLANSHYLKVYVQRGTIDENGTIDVRENKPAKDGDVFTKEGIYTVTVYDPSTDQSTPKEYYVGTDDRYKAYVTTGMDLEEIDTQIAQGATIDENGILIPVAAKASNQDNGALGESDESGSVPFPAVIAIVALILAVLWIVSRKKKRVKTVIPEDEK